MLDIFWNTQKINKRMTCKHPKPKPKPKKKKASPVTEVNFLTAVYPSGQMDLPSPKDAEYSAIFPGKIKS